MKLLPALLLAFALSLGVACASEPPPAATPLPVATVRTTAVPTQATAVPIQTTQILCETWTNPNEKIQSGGCDDGSEWFMDPDHYDGQRITRTRDRKTGCSTDTYPGVGIVNAFCDDNSIPPNSDQIVDISPEDTSRSNQVSPKTTMTAKEKLISIGYNVPKRGSVAEVNQEYVASLDVPDEYRERFLEIQTSINNVLGGYSNYIYALFNEEGSLEDARPVFERLSEIDYGNTRTIAGLIEAGACLSKTDPGEQRTSTTNPYGVCLESLAFNENPFNDGSPSENLRHPFRSYIRMAQHLAHEYFHHYQAVHALDRGLDYQEDRDNPETTVQAPIWWSEGAAVTFQNAWYGANWRSLSALKDLSPEEALSIVIANETDPSVYKTNRKNIMGYGDSDVCTPDWYLSSLDETDDTYSGCAAAFMATPYLAYLTSYKTVWIDIPQDYYDLGFWGALKKYTGMTKQEFYDSYNEFLRTGDPEDDPPAGWTPPEGPISAYADFWKIVPESD